MSVAQNKVSAALGRYEVEIKILKKGEREREREIERENYYKKNRL